MSSDPQGRRDGTTRRDFLKAGVAATLAAGAIGRAPAEGARRFDAAAAGQPAHRGSDAHEEPRQDGLPGRPLQPRRTVGARAAEQRGGCRAARRARARSRRQLHRHLVDLRRPGPVERALHRAGDEAPAQRGVPREQDEGTDARRVDADDREVAAAAQDRSPRPLAAPRRRHAGRPRRDLRQGRRDGGPARGEGTEDGPRARPHGTPSSGGADGSDSASPVRRPAARAERGGSRITTASPASCCRSPSSARWGSSG